MDDLVRELDGLVTDGVITREQADTIRRRVAARGRPAGRISLGTEALGYLGAVLVLASGATFLGTNWDEMAVAGRLGIAGGVAALALVGGWAIRRHQDDAVRRMSAAIWFVSTLAFSVGVAVLLSDQLELSGEAAALGTAAASSAYAGLLYLLHPRTILQLALLVGLVATTQIAIALQETTASTTHALGMWVLGGAWIVVSAAGLVRPRPTGIGLGALAALLGPAFGDDGSLAWLGAATAAALMAFGVLFKETLAMGFGAGGLFVYVTWLLSRGSDTLGLPLVLLLAGAVLIVLAVVTARLIRYTSRREPPAATPPP